MNNGAIKIILLIIAAFLTGFLVRNCTYKPPVPEIKEYRDTTYVTDTLWYPDPVEVTRYVRDTMWVDVGDIQIVHDTTYVSLPREYVTYQDTTYKAVVSGFMPRLEEIAVYPKKEIVTIQTEKVYTEYKHYKFGVGVQAGYGITPAGFQPYLGLGLSYNLFGF